MYDFKDLLLSDLKPFKTLTQYNLHRPPIEEPRIFYTILEGYDDPS